MARLRRARAAGAAVMAGLPVARDPAVRNYFGSKVNWFFLFAALVMYSIAWPTLPITHGLPAYALPVVAAFASLPLALGWSAPLVGWAISAVSAQVIGVVVPTVNGWAWTIQVTHLIVFLVLTFMAYLRCPLRLLGVVWACSTLVLVFAAPTEVRIGWAFGITVLAVMVGLLRVLMSSRQQLAVRTEETRALESESAVLQERARIARDLHDVVAHRMSMVVVMAQTARFRLTDVSDEAAAEFDAVADAARTSLDEVRQLLGVLRVDGVPVDAAPNPGLDDIDAVVAETRRAGAEITVHDTIEHAAVAESSGLVIYRIMQESLANATRHAPGGRIEVTLAYAEPGVIEVGVRNSAATSDPLRLSGAGTGVRGMIERAHAVGGSLTATAAGVGGFAVHAWIPVAARTRIGHSDNDIAWTSSVASGAATGER